MTTGSVIRKDSDLRELVDMTVKNYLDAHEAGMLPRNAYRLIMDEVEKTLLRRVMIFTDQNQLRSAAVLGISRNTLARKLRQYKLLPKS